MSRNSLSLVASVGLAMVLCGASPASAQKAPSLGAAETFAVLAGSTITNTGHSTIKGDLGLHPGTAITGFPAGEIVAGTKHAANPAALAAKNSLAAAYDNLVGQTCTQDLTGQNLGGKKLTAGVYCFAAAAQLTGTLTLDAQGNAKAVFIFKMGSTITTASASKVVLINRASPSNVFWQVGSSATLGTTTSFAGNILALASITVTTGVTMTGRTLARTAAVTLDTNAITVPRPDGTDDDDNACGSGEDNDRENGAALPAAATNSPPTARSRSAHIVEWDLPALADASPGAMVVDTLGKDNNRLWFVTRLGAQRVYRFDPSTSLMQGNASWQSWGLADDSVTTGGLKKIKASCDRQYVFVRTAASLQRVNMLNCSGGTCERTEWPDQFVDPNNPVTSDLAIDDRNNIFTTGATDPTDPSTSYVQMLTPGPYPGNGGIGTATVTRWQVGGGAGLCTNLGRTTTSFPCVSGIAVHPSNRNIVFYSEPAGNNIAALNISTSTVRRWSLSTLLPDEAGAVQQPRQLMIDRFGQVWVITGSGHLVSLDNGRYDQMRKHAIPLGALSDPFGLAPDDDVVGYTDAGQNKIGMLFPKGVSVSVSPTTSTDVPWTHLTMTVLGERADVTSGSVPPTGKVVQATITTKQDGVFVEAQLDSAPPSNMLAPNDSTSPLGITANRGKAEGTFFYAVGNATTHPTADRVGFVRLPMPQMVRRPRDDDDNEDGWDHTTHPDGWHHPQADDDGNGRDDNRDGIGNDYESPGNLANVDVPDDAPLGGGESTEYSVPTSASSLALIVTATADDLLAPIGIEIYNEAGMLVATSLPTPGVAVATLPLPSVGNYRVRVLNHGLTGGIICTTKFIVRKPKVP